MVKGGLSCRGPMQCTRYQVRLHDDQWCDLVSQVVEIVGGGASRHQHQSGHPEAGEVSVHHSQEWVGQGDEGDRPGGGGRGTPTQG